MWNIMKAQCYQLKRDRFIICALLFSVGIYIVFVATTAMGMEDINGGMMFYTSAEMLGVFTLLITLIITGRVCAWDFQDKTINYEVVFGHKRSAVYGARILLSYVLCLVVFTFLWGVPVLYGVMMGGWGPNLDMADTMFRILFEYVVLLRMVAEIILLSFLVRNSYITMVSGYFIQGILAMPSMIANDVNLYWTSALNQMLELLSYSNSKNIFVDGREVSYLISELSDVFVRNLLVSSAVIGGICLVLAYLFFKKSDMK